MWFLFAIISGFFFSSLNILERYLLKDTDSDPIAFTFFFSLTCSILCFPIIFLDLKFSNDPKSWLILFTVCGLLSANNILNSMAVKYSNATIVGTIGKFRIVWVFLIGLILAYETWSHAKGLGIFLTIIAGIILVAKFDQNSSFKGTVYAFTSTLFGGIAIALYTPLLDEFSVFTLTFLVFLFPTMINFVVLKNRIQRIKTQYKKQTWRLLVVGLFGAIANIAVITAINEGEASRVLVIVEAMFILVLIGEHFLLKNKTQIIRKSTAATLATIGAILMRIAS